MTASTIGNGRPSNHADTPATVPATIEIATLPISEEDTAGSSPRAPAASAPRRPGGANPNSQSVIVGRSISRNSARNVSVTSERSDPNTPPGDAEERVGRVGKARGEVLERVADLVVRARGRIEGLEPALLRDLVPVRRQAL